MVRLTSCIVFIAIALTCVLADEEKYSDQYDDIDVNSIFATEKLQVQYYKCFMDQGPCKTAPMRFFKGIAFIYTSWFSFRALVFFLRVLC